MFAYEENLNPLSNPTVFFQTKIRSENPETSIAEKNGKKRCLPKRKGNQEYPELFESIAVLKTRGTGFINLVMN